MIARIAGASMRAVLVAVLVATPALMLQADAAGTPQMVVLIALMAALLTFIEYSARSPSIVEFRDAPPFNRLRFMALFATVLLLSVLCRGLAEPTLLSRAVTSAGALVATALDLPLSPLRMVSFMLPDAPEPDLVATVRAAAALAGLVSLAMLAAFLVAVRLAGWPGRRCGFNLWVNLPVFDPASGDVLEQLRRDARFNIALGLLLPFLIPAVVKLARFLVDPVTLDNPQTLIWTVTAWAFLPASTIMRGLALGRVAHMIEEKRRRAARLARTEPDLQPV